MRIVRQVVRWTLLSALLAGGGCGSEQPNHPPEIHSLDLSAVELDDDATLSVVARVTDPEGPQDLVGGILWSEDGGLIGAFTAKSSGLFQLDVGWSALVAGVPFDFYGSETRMYVARFTDFAGEEAARDFPVTFRCPELSGGCGHTCQRLDQDSACGGCGVACPQGQECNPIQSPPACVPRSVSIDEWGPEFGEYYCDMLFRCCSYAELQDMMQDRFTDVEGCIDFTSLYFRDWTSDWREAIAAGRGVYDPVAAGACFEVLNAAECGGGLFAGLAGCEAFYQGTQPAGAECAGPSECQEGTSCIILSGEDTGTCKAYLDLGVVCNLPDSADCIPETLYCDNPTGRCADRKPLDAPCLNYYECRVELECIDLKCQFPEPVCDGF